MSDDKVRPVKKVKSGSVTATVWKNEIVVNGDVKDVFSIDVTRVYKSGDEWKTTTTMRSQDLPRVKMLLDVVYAFIEVKEVI